MFGDATAELTLSPDFRSACEGKDPLRLGNDAAIGNCKRYEKVKVILNSDFSLHGTACALLPDYVPSWHAGGNIVADGAIIASVVILWKKLVVTVHSSGWPKETFNEEQLQMHQKRDRKGKQTAAL